MSKREEKIILKDLHEAILRIIAYTSDFDYDDFTQNQKTQDAVIRNIEILGEAVKLLTEKTKDLYPEIPWKDIAGTRDKLIHDFLVLILILFGLL